MAPVPTMTDGAERWRRLEEVCEAALERPAEERAAFLAHACGGDEDLRCEAASLLEREARAHGFLETPVGELAANAMKDAVTAAGGRVVEVDQFTPTPAGALEPAGKVAKSGADAVLVAQGGPVLRAIAPTMNASPNQKEKIQLLGTGLWDEDSLSREAALEGGWYAAPEPNADAGFIAKYRATFGAAPANIASLAYDAVALVALLSPGEAYHRFTRPALMDPNGFSGVNGIFRFNADGTSERGLAVLEMTSDGPIVASPAPTTFQRAAF